MFDDAFRVCFADTPFGVALHQRIRYQVFRCDKGFSFVDSVEDEDDHFEVVEADIWDDKAAHFIVQNKQSLQWVAATRVIIQKPGGRLPVDDHKNAFDRSLLEDPHMQLGEISRFCIISNRSKVAAEDDQGANTRSADGWGIDSAGKQHQFEVTLGMMRAVGIYALKRNTDHCIMMITDAFARLLRKLGVTLVAVGPPTDYLGMRTAYLVNMRDAVASMSQKSTAVRQLFKRAKHAYVRISGVANQELVDTVSEFAPDHSLFNETMFRETVLMPADHDSDLKQGGGG